MSLGTPASVRELLVSQLSLAASVGSQLGIANEQLARLRRGQPVELSSAQLRGFVAECDRPGCDLDQHDRWLLVGANELQPIADE